MCITVNTSTGWKMCLERPEWIPLLLQPIQIPMFGDLN